MCHITPTSSRTYRRDEDLVGTYRVTFPFQEWSQFILLPSSNNTWLDDVIRDYLVGVYLREYDSEVQ